MKARAPASERAQRWSQLREGRLLRARAFFDLHDAGVQLGVFPKPGTAGQRALLMLRGFGLRNG